MKMQSPTVTEYKIREGTVNLGKEYEVNVLTLLSLQCLRHSKEDFWFASNADGVGAFDDIVLHLGEHTFMLQLKQTTKEKPKPITEQQFLASQKKEFYLKKYILDICEVKQTLNSINIGDGTGEITTQLDNFDKVYFLLYTNKVAERCDFLIDYNTNGPLSYLNTKTDSKIFQIEVEKVSIGMGLDDVKGINNFYIFCNQIDAKDVPNKIEEEIRKITRSNYSKAVSEDLIKFVIEWSKGNLGGHFCLTKRDIVSKLTELLLSNYEIKLLEEPFSFYESEQKFVWNKLVKDKTITIIDTNNEDRLIFNFLLEYIGSEVKDRFNASKRKRWFDNLPQKDQKVFYMENPNFKWQIFKTAGAGNCDKIVLYHVYKCLWNLHELPLVLEISKKEQYRQICDVLKLSNYAYKVIILNKSGEILTLDRKIRHFVTLNDLNTENKEEVLKQHIEFQGRLGATLRELIDETMFAEIKAIDVINILLGTYSIGKKLNTLPKYYIPRMFKNALSYNTLKYVSSSEDIYFIKDHYKFFKRFAAKENIEICCLDNNDLINTIGFRIIVCNRLPEYENLKQIRKKIHYLVAQDIDYLIWKQSFHCKEEDYRSKYCILSEHEISLRLTTVISANPGMGKSLLMKSIALKTPTNKWLIKIDLRKHTGYYENLKNKNTELKSLQHLNYFKGHLEGQLENNIFEKLVRSRDVVILMDGFDEISISYKNEVTEIAKSFYQDKFCVYLTTRPIEKSHLESEFNVIALELRPFSFDNQKQFLREYLENNQESLVTFDIVIDEFTEKILNGSERSRQNTNVDFLAIPLHIELLGEVFIDDWDKYLINRGETDIKNIVDLVDLYRRFINKKDKILCDKFNFNDSYFLYKDCQRLLALRFLFPDCIHDITECMHRYGKAEANYIKLIEKGGILTVDEKLNVSFSHQTFAEYLAAEWLAENIDNSNSEVENIVRSVYETCTGISSDGQHYPLLFDAFNRLIIENGFHGDNLYKNIYLCITNGKVDEAREIINLNAAVLNTVDKAKRLILHLVVLYCEQYPLLKDVFLLIVENTLEIHADVCGYNPIDYALRNRLYIMSDVMCQKWPHSKINVNPHYFSKKMFDDRSSYPHMVNSIIIYYAYVDIMLKKVEKNRNIDSYIKNYIGSNIKLTSTDLCISKLPALKSYTECNLSYEVTFGNIRTVKRLLKTIEKVNIKDPRGYTPLHYAALYNKLNVIDLLLSKNAIVDTADQYGHTPLYCSIKSDNFRAFRKLLRKADINSKVYSIYMPLHSAVAYKRVKMIDLLLSRGTEVTTENQWGATPLHLIGQHHDDKSLFFFTSKENKIIDLLISKGANINAKTLLGETALHYNASRGNRKVIIKLLSYNADINLQNNEGDTPLHKAAAASKVDVMELLLSNGANVNIKNIKGESPLFFSIAYCTYKSVEQLLHCGAHVNAQNNAGNTPLHKAIIINKIDVVDLLLSKGANVNIRNVKGESPIYLGIYYGNYKIVQTLLRYGVEINLQNNEGNTPLHHAIANRQKLQIINLLMSNGADINIKNIYGETAFYFAFKYGNYQIVKELICKPGINEQNESENIPLNLLFTGNEEEKISVYLSIKYGDYANILLYKRHINFQRRYSM